MTCERNAARYSMAESKLAFQTARRKLSSFIVLIHGVRPRSVQASDQSQETLTPTLTSIHRKIRHAASVGKCQQYCQDQDPDSLKRHDVDKEFDRRGDK